MRENTGLPRRTEIDGEGLTGRRERGSGEDYASKSSQVNYFKMWCVLLTRVGDLSPNVRTAIKGNVVICVPWYFKEGL